MDNSVKNNFREYNLKEGIRYKVIKHSDKNLIGLEGVLLDWNKKYMIIDLEMHGHSITPDGEKDCIIYQPHRFSKDCLMQVDNKTGKTKIRNNE